MYYKQDFTYLLYYFLYNLYIRNRILVAFPNIVVDFVWFSTTRPILKEKEQKLIEQNFTVLPPLHFYFKQTTKVLFNSDNSFFLFRYPFLP
jgi:hypothetical protein